MVLRYKLLYAINFYETIQSEPKNINLNYEFYELAIAQKASPKSL